MSGKKSLVLLLALCFGVSLSAATPWFSHGSKRRPVTLIVTGNYKSPRLMADLIQVESRQPYLLLSEGKYFLCFPKTAALQVPNSKLNECIRTLGPRRLVILGDERYVPADFSKRLDGAIPVVRIEAREWNCVARELDELLNLGRLERNYRSLREQLDNEELNRPMRNPVAEKTAEEAAAMVPPAGKDAPAPADPKDAPVPADKKDAAAK